jgi:arylsulfatase A-like enzyme
MVRLASLLALLCSVLSAAEKANVLIIVADDLGYQDVGFQGSTEIKTPHLDKLAAASIRCTSGYANHSFCSPTRAALLTGRYQHRFGHETNPAWLPQDIKAGLALDQITLPSLMAEAGYATGMVGKWHLGAHPDLHPMKRGFQEYYGILGGGHAYFPGGKSDVEYTIPMNRNGKDEPLAKYVTTQLGEEAAAFVKRHAQGAPWLLYLPFNAPHTPLEAPQEWREKYSHIQNADRRTYATMIGAMDEAIGTVLTEIQATGQTDRTLVCFMSDNGGPDLSAKRGSSFTDNTPLRGAKGQVFEGGIRVPFLISLPSQLKPGVFDHPVAGFDLFATALALAGAEVPKDRPMDGVNLLPHLKGENAAAPHEVLHWRSQGAKGDHALRKGNWKLVKKGAQAPQLFDLSQDIAEAHDLAAQQPEILKELEAQRAAWSQSMMEPTYLNPQQQRAKGKAKSKAK